MGEAKFIRAFCNFYLVNLFGPIPIVTTVNWRNTNLLYRSQEQDVYALIVEDLIEAVDEKAKAHSADLVLADQKPSTK